MKIPNRLKFKQVSLLVIASSALLSLASSLFAQTDEKKKPAPGFEVIEKTSAPQIGILVEYFKLDHRTANKLVSQFSPKAANAKELRNTLGEMTKKGKAELVDTGWLRGRSGQRAKTESIREHIYPTEYDPPEIPNIVGGVPTVETKDQNAKNAVNQLRDQGKPMMAAIHMTSANPTAFETRNLGLTLEVDPVVGRGNKVITLNIATEIITHLEDTNFLRPGYEHTAHGVENVLMPTFYAIKETTQITAIPGNYNLFGIHTPHDEPGNRIIVLLKADIFFAK